MPSPPARTNHPIHLISPEQTPEKRPRHSYDATQQGNVHKACAPEFYCELAQMLFNSKSALVTGLVLTSD